MIVHDKDQYSTMLYSLLCKVQHTDIISPLIFLEKAICSTVHVHALDAVWHPGDEVAANIKGSINKFKSYPGAYILLYA